MAPEPSEARKMSGDDLDRHARLHKEIQQCRIEMVYCSLLERRRLQRRMMRAEAELCRMPATTPVPR
jgi:hypothetical protein